MPGLTMTDCSVADNVMQAKWEFERAMGTESTQAFMTWSLKWGASLLEVAAEHAGEEYIEIGRAAAEKATAESEVEELEEEIEGLHTKIRAAIDKLESCL